MVRESLDPAPSIVYSYWTVRDSHDPRLAVGLVGLGNMGTAFAERLLDAGYTLVVHNRTRERAEALVPRGAVVATTVGELAGQVDVIVTSLADDEALEAVGADVVDAARPGATLVDASTVSPDASARVAARAEAAGVGYLRAPVSGNPNVVRAGNLSFIVSGPRDALDRVEPVIRAIGPTVHHVGDGEQARIVKLAINLVIGGLAELMAEALVLGEASGVSRAALLEVMGASAAGAPFVKYKTDALLRDDYSATFTTALMEKDVDLILDAADTAGVELPIAHEMKAVLRAAIEAGYGDDDFMALFPFLRSAAGRHAAAARAQPSRVGGHSDQEVSE
jgi:3-hydroxyisobutyrate dehydrogenase-like beta-hydroxyacid dehydrogenase